MNYCDGPATGGGKRSIAYYVSAHGYGHGVRSCNIISAINRLYPPVTVHIVSALPESFLDNRIDARSNSVRAGAFDVGMVQIDSIRVDIDATRAAVDALCSARKELVTREIAFLRERSIDLVVADIPALPFEAAAAAGVPAVAVGNFSWDWIYSDFISRDDRWRGYVEIFREQYAKADLLLRLPFCDEMKTFQCVEDIPLVASPGTPRREEIRGMTGCDPRKKWILLSFTTLDLDSSALRKIELIDDCEFFTVSPLCWDGVAIHVLDRRRVTFPDIVASMDAVVSKPGFGILSDCIANRKPLVYADRSDFLEYPILEAAVKKYLRHVHIAAEDLYRGNVRESLDRLWTSAEPQSSLPCGGDLVAARRLGRFLSL
ncbi:MAG TPA: hypothetical protein VLL97_06445 [Acidobacteriota bacterium]|nr:hypothetical protein [Acidobacteriota bacterium]